MNTTPKSWFKHTLRILAFILIAILTVASLMNGTAAGGSDSPADGEQYQTVELPPGAASLSPDALTTAPTPSHPKLDTTMAKLAAEARNSPGEALNSAGSNLVRVDEGRVQVQVITSPDVRDSAVEVVIQAGGEVTGVAFNDTVIQGWLPVTSLEGVASNDAVYYVQRPVTLVLDEIQATTEGLAVMNGNDWHTAGYNGTGAKIGVIDGGFQGYPSLLGSDLPSSLTVKNFVDGETDAQVDGTTKHGTACAEIVYDIAPGATMYLAKVASDVDLEEAVNWLKNTHHVDVISTSLSYFNTSPGDGTGYLANLVQNARNAGILWAKSAGNYREFHWGGAFYDPDGDNYHNFDGEQEINFFGPGDGSAYYISSGNYLRVFLRWDDWTSVNQDYNLHLVRYNGSSWDLVVSSTDTQNGGGGQQPTEAVIGLTSGSSAPYGFLIERISSSRNVHFEVLAPSTAHLDEYVFARSMGDPADAPAIVAVAALDVVSPYPQESYSSEGPTNGPGGTESGGFTKPDISGFANVSTASYGAGGFGGTSSATPHVAGAAALVFGAYPGYTPDQVQSFLEGRAIDMGPAGMDTRFGHGRLYLGDPPGPPADKVWNGDVSNNWHTAGNWTPSGVPSSSDTVLIPDTTRDPVVSSSNAAAEELTINAGAQLDLTTRLITVEGTVSSSGILKQTRDVSVGSTTQFLRIKNQAGTQTQYYGADISPTSIGESAINRVEVARQDVADMSFLQRAVMVVNDWIVGIFQRDKSDQAEKGEARMSAPPTSEFQDSSIQERPRLPYMENRAVLGEPASGSLTQSTVSETPAPPTNSRQVELKADSLPATPHEPGAETISAEGIYGQVTYNGTAASNIYLILRFYNGSSWSTWGSPVSTDVNGDYLFTGVPSLGSGEAYYVRYENGEHGNLDVTDYLSAWYSYNITSYAGGSSAAGGDFDLADVVQVSPNPGVTVTLPQTFTWSRRSATTDDSYTFNLFDPDDSDPWYETSDLGYADSYSLTSLPDGFSYNTEYGWIALVYAPDGGVGYPYYYSPITITDNGATATATATATQTTTTTVTPPTLTPTPTQTQPPGDTAVTVMIYGDQYCSGLNKGVDRCFDIEPSSAMNASVRFYFTEDERNGINKSNLLVYHYTTQWEQEPGPLTYGGTGNGQYVEAQNVDNFSTFALDQETGGPYLPLLLNYFPEPTGPESGFWEDNSSPGTEFYVTPDRAYVDDFAIYISISGCGNFKITHSIPEPIANDQFSFSGSFYASGTFNSTTTASGTAGLDSFYIPGCGNITGSHSWIAIWKNSSQPSGISVEIVEIESVELETNPERDYYEVIR